MFISVQAVANVSSVLITRFPYLARSKFFLIPGPAQIHGMCLLRGSFGPWPQPWPP